MIDRMLLAGSLVALWSVTPPVARCDVSFIRDVAPIVVHKCAACHNHKTAESNYRLDSFERLMTPGDFELPPVTAGDLEESEIYRLILAEDPAERMPNNGDRLTDAEIETVRLWISAGAAFDGADPAGALTDQLPPPRYPAAPERYPGPIPITAMAFAPPDGQLLVSGYHELTVWNPADGALVRRLGNLPQRVFGLALSPDHSQLAVAGGTPGVSGQLHLLSGENWADSKLLAQAEDLFFDVAFRPNRPELAVAGADGTVRLINLESGALVRQFNHHADFVVAVAWNPAGNLLASASHDKSVKLVDADTGDLQQTYAAHNAKVNDVLFTADGNQVLSCGDDRKVHAWNPADGKKLGEIAGWGGEVLALAIAGEFGLATAADRTVRQFQLADLAVVRSLSDQPDWVLSLAVDAEARQFSTGSFDGTIRVWNLADGSRSAEFPGAPLEGRP